MRLTSNIILCILVSALISFSQSIRISPAIDMLYTGGGCTFTELSFRTVDNPIGNDTIIIKPWFNTSMWTIDSLGFPIYFDEIYVIFDDTLNTNDFYAVLLDATPGNTQMPRFFKPDSVEGIFYNFYIIAFEAYKDDEWKGEISQYFEYQGGIGIEDDAVQTYNAESFVLLSNYPNPFNPTTTIKFENMVPGKIRIDIFNITGQFVETFYHQQTPVGLHKVQFDGEDLSSGVYFYRISSNNFAKTKKMILLK